ncbi:MAG: glycosyltransferase, partial [Microthrixaceae bacterium]|nr:glycosyltransferase [Microthrixaceae bacterium]
PDVAIVVPCFNEAARMHPVRYRMVANDPRVSLIFVDDASTDRTAVLLDEFVSTHERASMISLESNGGKGEAVRAGLVRAIGGGVSWVGYLDADLSTPPEEMLRLVDVATTSEHLEVVMGARVAMLGRHITRSPLRHYPGRVFATGASLVLNKAVYDTQCGAKLFRVGEALRSATSTPFRSRWAFDVELLGRLDRSGVPPSGFWEEPLLAWADVAPSRRSVWASVRAACDLPGIRRDLRAWGRK